MFIKLNYTSAKPMQTFWRIITDIVNTPSVTDITSLIARATSANYNSVLTANLDTATSEIVRTAADSNVTSHFSMSDDVWKSTFQFSVYDSPSTQFYAQVGHITTGSSMAGFSVGTALTGGTMSSTQLSLTDFSASGLSILSTSGTSDTNANAHADTDVYSVWAYITNDCILWSYNTALSPTGWGSGTSALGPYIISQYTRYDYINTMDNGVFPVIYPNPARDSANSSLDSTDFAANKNPGFVATNSSSVVPFKVLNFIANQNSSNVFSWPITNNVQVAHTVNGISSCDGRAGLYNSTVQDGSDYTVVFNKLLSNTVNEKVPNKTLTGTTYLHYPLGWIHDYYLAMGGSISDRSGVFLFNGDYTPGDEYTVDGITYSLWPINSITTSASYRIGLGVPKK